MIEPLPEFKKVKIEDSVDKKGKIFNMLAKTALMVVFLVMVLMYSPISFDVTSKARTAEVLTKNQNIKLVVLEGTPYNRGLVHGKTLRKEIQDLVQIWKSDLEVRYKTDADAFISRFLKKTNFPISIKKWTPQLLEEVRGIADGSGIDFNTIFMFQLMDELWANGEDVAADHCSSLGVNKRGTNPTYVAQNMDIPWLFQGRQTLLHIKHENSDLESFVLTAPGLIGLNGMNNKSVAIACNTLSQLQGSRDGLPVAFIVRGVLEKQTLKDAVQFIHDIKHASGQNYIIGGKEKAASYECSANKISQYIPYQGAEITYHTNHPLVNDDYTAAFLSRLKRLNNKVYARTSTAFRFESLETRLKANSIDMDIIKSTLCSRDSENGSISNDLTFGSTIMVLSEKPELYVAPGRPDLIAFKIFRFSDKTQVSKK